MLISGLSLEWRIAQSPVGRMIREPGFFLMPGVMGMAGPGIRGHVRHKAGTYGLILDQARTGHKIGNRIDHGRAETTFPQTAGTALARVEVRNVKATE